MARTFFGDDHREGDPPAKGKGGAAGNVLTEDMGPLPVWGWIVVAVAAVFLWRKISGAGAAAAAPTAPQATTGGGRVILVPGSLPATSQTPASGSNPADIQSAYSYESTLIENAATKIYQQGPGALGAALSGVSLYNYPNFMDQARNIAAYQLHLPYVDAGGNLVNPAGGTIPLSTYTSLRSANPLAYEALALGRSDAWQAAQAGTLPTTTAPGSAPVPPAAASPVTGGGPAIAAAPIYPNTAPLPVGSCPAGYVTEVGATGWTCATADQHNGLIAYLKALAAH